MNVVICKQRNSCQAGLTMLMFCVTAGTIIPETTTAEVDTIPGEQNIFVTYILHLCLKSMINILTIYSNLLIALVNLVISGSNALLE